MNTKFLIISSLLLPLAVMANQHSDTDYYVGYDSALIGNRSQTFASTNVIIHQLNFGKLNKRTKNTRSGMESTILYMPKYEQSGSRYYI